mmetsp:Transcript_56123/g.154680  ORF Transcript_56123/g.154680 Transcript_56123/m.154680 type:complete len:275 (+) Transcript_56123:417-1241(+)
MWPTCREPVMPNGWPIEMEPPLTFIFSGSMPRRRWFSSATTAKASLSSQRSMSSTVRPWRESRRGTATAGPMPISSGSHPPTTGGDGDGGGGGCGGDSGGGHGDDIGVVMVATVAVAVSVVMVMTVAAAAVARPWWSPWRCFFSPKPLKIPSASMPFCCASFSSITTCAAAPSLNCEALPAVTVALGLRSEPSFLKRMMGVMPASASYVVSGRLQSSWVTVTSTRDTSLVSLSTTFMTVSMGAISASYKPAACAAAVRCCERREYWSRSSRLTP